MDSLNGSAVLVTGASSGLGAQTALLLAERGATVILVARDEDGLATVASEVRERGGHPIISPADVTDCGSLAQAIEASVSQAGGLDAVVVNAGAAAYGQLREMTAQDVRDTIDVTLLGAVNTIMLTLPHLELSSGRIVATGSVAALQPQPLMAAYSAAKHGLRAMLESLRIELRAVGSAVGITLVHPGPIDTPFWTHVRAVGVTPAEPPAAYAVDDVARALVAAVEGPQRDTIVGPAMRLALLLRDAARPVSDIALTAVTRWALDNQSGDEPKDSLSAPAGDGRRETGDPLHIGALRARVFRAVGVR